MAQVTVNKLDAARRQIDEAVRLLFENRDPVAIHTLAAAAFEILRDLCKKTDDSEVLRAFDEILRPGMEREFWGVFKSASNFFKHANRDPQGTMTYGEEANDILLFLCCALFLDLEQPFTHEMRVLVAWTALFYPQYVKGPLKDAIRLHVDVGRLHQMSRVERLEFGGQALDELRQLEGDGAGGM